MASTTSAAASMLLSGSTASADGIAASYLAGRLIPCSTPTASISASAPFPTITLDLTKNPAAQFGLQHLAAPGTNNFSMPFAIDGSGLGGAVNPHGAMIGGHPFSLPILTSTVPSHNASMLNPSIFSSGKFPGMTNTSYPLEHAGIQHQQQHPFNQLFQGNISQVSGNAMMQAAANRGVAGPQSLAESVSAATAAITADPNFTAALAA
eukprot:c16328_g1_i1 orf=1-621(-)